MAIASSGSAFTSFCGFSASGGACGTIDFVSFASGFVGPSWRGIGIVFTIVTPTDPVLVVVDPMFLFVRFHNPDATSSPSTTP
jgi:hypothetical protein